MDSLADKARRPLDNKPVSPSLFAHFVLRTANREPLKKWYMTVLNARLVFENEYIAFITYDDEHHRVAFVQIPGLKKAPDDSWGLAHVAYTLADLTSIATVYQVTPFLLCLGLLAAFLPRHPGRPAHLL